MKRSDFSCPFGIDFDSSSIAFAAPWLACRLPCQRFVSHLATRYAWLGASMVCYSFSVEDLHLCSLPISRRTRLQ